MFLSPYPKVVRERGIYVIYEITISAALHQSKDW